MVISCFLFHNYILLFNGTHFGQNKIRNYLFSSKVVYHNKSELIFHLRIFSQKLFCPYYLVKNKEAVCLYVHVPLNYHV